jgi:N6-L-threonylcarbamoyladenine synthase
MRILGIETSCDETAAAILDDGAIVRSSVVASQVDLHARYGGVVPELASRRHVERLLPVIDLALEQAGAPWSSVEAVAVTCGPGLVGALAVGVAAAKSLALARGLRFIGVNHLEGHLFANVIAHGVLPSRSLALIASGAHSDLVWIEAPHRYDVIGRTRDDAAGEAFDKVARAMGLGYPGGPALDRLGRSGNAAAVPIPVPMLDQARDRYDFSFSGVKTAAVRFLAAAGQEPAVHANVAASLQRVVAEALVGTMARAARQKRPTALVLAGGVAANSVLRVRLDAEARRLGVPVLIPPPDLCTDNAAMIAACGASRLARGEGSPLNVGASADLPL